MTTQTPPGEILLRAFAAGIDAVNGESGVRNYIRQNPLPPQPVVVLAVGKAAAQMASGAVAGLGEQIHSGLVITRYGHAAGVHLPACLTLMEAGHPLPDTNSLRAGQAAVDLLHALPDSQQLLILLSGGTSALLEQLPEGVDLAALIKLNHWLLGSGLAIDQVNHLRQSISCLKGGRLAQHLKGQVAHNLLISDVPGDDFALIGSGPFYPDATVEASTREQDMPTLPGWVRELQRQAQAAVVPESLVQASTGGTSQQIEHVLIASNAHACRAAADSVAAQGIPVWQHTRPLQGEAQSWAGQCVAQLNTLSAGVHIWGGETQVMLPPQAGRGGRNQHLALAAARGIAGREGVYLLAVGTDGSDGNSEDCGALVDGQTVARGEEQGLDALDCLRRADAGHFLDASGDLIHTGPTGSNVMDLVMLYKAGV